MSLITIHLAKEPYNSLEFVVEKLKHTWHDEIHNENRQCSLDQTTIPYCLEIQHHSARNSIIVSPVFPQFQLVKHGRALYEAASLAIGQLIVEHCEAEIIMELLNRRCRHTKLQPEKIALYCHNILNNDPWEPLGKKFSDQDRARRRNKIVEELIQYFESNSELDVVGYVAFRMESYKQELNEVIEYAIDEYALDQQYEEFMTLLKYFVGLQETKTELVHLVHQESNGFILCDEDMKPLELKHEHDRIVAEMLETEINIEDIVISSLISASPQKIIVHAKHQDYQVVRTVKTIFGDRAQLCSTCPMCRHSREEIIPFH